MKIKLTAYHKWLLQVAGSDKLKLAVKIESECREHNKLAFELLEMTGDDIYAPITLFKAADILLNS